MQDTQKAQEGEAHPSFNAHPPPDPTTDEDGSHMVALEFHTEPCSPIQTRLLGFFHSHSWCSMWTVHSPTCLRRLHPNQNLLPSAPQPCLCPHRRQPHRHTGLHKAQRGGSLAASPHTPTPSTRDSKHVRGRAGESASWDWQHLGVISAPLVQTIGQ